MVSSAIQDVEEWNTKVKQGLKEKARQEELNKPPPFEVAPKPETNKKLLKKKTTKRPHEDELRDAS
jgi:hypothetical protein